jgi:mono/diheme cytochrome c family protein
MRVYEILALGIALLVGVACDVGTFAGQLSAPESRSETAQPHQDQIERGRYLVKITGCNDCHTTGYPQNGGNVPEQQWLTGDTLGFRGPWGTTYPTNLRLYMQHMSEAQWVHLAQNLQTRPPMPWFALRDMAEADLRAMYHFIKFLGPAGDPAPAYLLPDQEPPAPYVLFPTPPQ